ncbi:hypothetical protein D1609_07610 [Leptospira borgpetersenii serovar Hardjo-bovis]|nr:hypothetical protein D1609_07610 [Leptospira borgpetersenii serovar Hardjo-bovis]
MGQVQNRKFQKRLLKNFQTLTRKPQLVEQVFHGDQLNFRIGFACYVHQFMQLQHIELPRKNRTQLQLREFFCTSVSSNSGKIHFLSSYLSVSPEDPKEYQLIFRVKCMKNAKDANATTEPMSKA